VTFDLGGLKPRFCLQWQCLATPALGRTPDD